QMVEVAYEIRDKASYIVGSEESPPDRGYFYNRLMQNLTESPEQSPRTFASFIAQDTLAAYGSDPDPIFSITQSVLEASQVGALAPALNQLGASLSAAQPAWATQIANARRGAENYGYIENRDLTDFLNNLAPVGGTPTVNDAGVLASIQGVRTALGTTIITNANGSGHPRSRGLAIYLPSPSQYIATEEAQEDGYGQPYRALSFTKAAPAWRNFLQTGPR
ncbi:MAG: clostripain-related cysteine peptidase, partial [Armatimonadota bacterium]